MTQEIVEERNLISVPWIQMDDEPDMWYRRFMMYYLTLGPTRNLTRAFIKYLETEQPDAATLVRADSKFVNISRAWSSTARQWKWRERAEAFDLHSSTEIFAYVDRARDTLLKNADEAAQALVKNLTNPRLAVAAAKEILDRAGLPGTHLVGVSRVEPYTADDLRKAETEVADWERQIRGDIIDVDKEAD